MEEVSVISGLVLHQNFFAESFGIDDVGLWNKVCQIVVPPARAAKSKQFIQLCLPPLLHVCITVKHHFRKGTFSETSNSGGHRKLTPVLLYHLVIVFLLVEPSLERTENVASHGLQFFCLCNTLCFSSVSSTLSSSCYPDTWLSKTVHFRSTLYRVSI